MHPLAQRITDLASRARRVAVLVAAARIAGVVLGVALVLMAADYVMRLTDPGMRWLSAAVLLAAAYAAAQRWLLPRAWRAVTPLSISQQVQSAWPSLGSRLASAIEFLHQKSTDPSAGSPDLRRSVVIQVASEVEGLNLGKVIDRRPLRRTLQIVAATVLGFAAFGLFDPGGLKTAAARLLTPWQDNQWPRKHHLLVEDAPQRIARGQQFTARVTDELQEPLPVDLCVQYRSRLRGDTRLEEQPLVGEQSLASIVRENVQQSFAFRVTGGDDLTMDWREVEVVEPPRVDNLQLQIAPPAYSGLALRTVLDQDRVLAGGLLHASAEAVEPIEAAALEVELEDDAPQLFPLAIGPSGAVTSLRLKEPLKLTAGQPKTASVRLRITSSDGLIGFTERTRLRIEPDPAPTVQWVTPTRELLVTNQALVPVTVLIEDNLAIRSADFLWRKVAVSADEPEPPTGRQKIYAGAETPPRRSSPVWGSPAESREVGYGYDLAPLGLQPGDQVDILAESSDYRPGVGATRMPQRITILSEEEFDSRIADKQAALMQDLERLLREQRATREASGELLIEREQQQPLDRQAIDRLSTLGFEQVRIKEGVSDPSRGAVRQARDLLDELAMNRLERPELAEQLGVVRGELARLSDGPLDSAGRELTDARRSAQRAVEESGSTEQQLKQSLADATNNQDKVIEGLEQLLDQMADWSNYQRFAQELAELEDKQRGLREETLKEATRAAVEGDQAKSAAARQKLTAAQSEVSRRFRKLLDAMRRSAAEGSEDSSSATQPLKDALAESQDRDTQGQLSEAERQIRNGQLGLSARAQDQGAEDLKEMLDILRDRASSDPAKLAQQLEQAQKKLSELQKELDKLEKQADQPAQQQPRQKLADKTKRLGRRLNRLDAPQAAQSAQQGAGQMQQSSEEGEQGRQSMGEAQQSLQDAQQQLAEKIKQLKDILALRELDRLAARMEGFIQRQREVLNGTVSAEQEKNAGALDEEFNAQAERLSKEQDELRADVDVARRNVAKREAFELALRGALDQMQGALQRLQQQKVDRPTQRREYAALERLRHIADALKITPPEPEEDQQGGGGGGQSGEPKPPSPIDVAELKMLRLMQLDLNTQTRELEAEAADKSLSPQETRREAQGLSERQEQLGDLVRELIERNNKPPPQPGELPDDAV